MSRVKRDTDLCSLGVARHRRYGTRGDSVINPPLELTAGCFGTRVAYGGVCQVSNLELLTDRGLTSAVFAGE